MKPADAELAKEPNHLITRMLLRSWNEIMAAHRLLCLKVQTALKQIPRDSRCATSAPACFARGTGDKVQAMVMRRTNGQHGRGWTMVNVYQPCTADAAKARRMWKPMQGMNRALHPVHATAGTGCKGRVGRARNLRYPRNEYRSDTSIHVPVLFLWHVFDHKCR